MSDEHNRFTYTVNNDEFLEDFIAHLEYKKYNDIASNFQGAKCSVINTNSFSRRHNAFWAVVEFRVPINFLRNIEKTYDKDELKQILEEICREVIDKDIGFDIYEVKLIPRGKHEKRTKSLTEEISELTKDMKTELISQLLPSDLRKKGKEMAEVYYYLYCIENSLRFFIEIAAKKEYGDNLEN